MSCKRFSLAEDFGRKSEIAASKGVLIAKLRVVYYNGRDGKLRPFFFCIAKRYAFDSGRMIYKTGTGLPGTYGSVQNGV